MDIQIKQRIVGICVLVVMLLAILSLMFNHTYPLPSTANNTAPEKTYAEATPSKSEQMVSFQLPNSTAVEHSAPTPAADKADIAKENQEEIIKKTEKANTALAKDAVVDSDIEEKDTAHLSVLNQAAALKTEHLDNEDRVTIPPIRAEKQAVANNQVTNSPVISQPSEKKQVMQPIHANPVNHPAIAKKNEVNSNNGKDWIIQLGLFSNQKNVDDLLRKLHAKRFNVHVSKTIVGPHKSVLRVYIGPLQANSARQIQNQLKTQFNLNGILKRQTL